MEIASLPSDLLVLIFRRIPRRPRLLVLARVCHRWHKAVLMSLQSLPLRVPESFVSLPSVTSLRDAKVAHNSANPLRFALPASLLHLRYKHAHTGCACHFLRPLTALTHLEIGLTHCCMEAVELIRRNTNIAKLSIFFWLLRDEQTDALRSVRLPRLTALDISGDDERLEQDFTRAHAAQLISGAFEPTCWDETSKEPWLPRLREASIRAYSARPASFVHVLAVAPHLTSLTVEVHDALPAVPASLISTLRLHCQTRSSAHVNFLTQLTRLDSLMLPAFHLPGLPILTRLRTLYVTGSCSDEQDLSLFMLATQLTSLTIPTALLQRTWSHWPFLSLQALTVDMPPTQGNVCHFLAPIVKRSRHLSRLEFCSKYTPANKAFILELLLLAERRGVRTVTLRTSPLTAEEKREIVERFRWLKVVCEKL